ncbi:MAG: glycosyltransferase family A protein [Parvibaculum sp.]|uniref:glycosyltransferase family 2 protein n=1 Tax=Parvibaculum sp. TaxID=2024848 RepID=UPI002ABBB7EF|nr:glycosyltransferase family A protein [Parvibaculum sp.]MDZ4381587.1 glycosyltransferase family A protein [Parvibaculum sp.]
MAVEALPKFTVIIPTRARADVLPAALRTVVAQDYENLEILVSDNFSEDGTADIVHALNDPRIRYINTGRRLSMSHNWEFALSHVDGGWVTFLGDDDGLMPGAIAKVVEMARDASVSAIRSATCKYRWPAADGKGGRLAIPTRRGTELRDSDEWLQRAMAGNASYMDLPMLYTGGFADIRVMHEIKAKMGMFFSSCNPDVYSGIAIASVTKNYLYSRYPMAIAGISRHSTGTSHFSRPENKLEMSPAQRFISENNIPFHPDIPVCRDGITPRSVQVTLLESYLQSLPLRSQVPKYLHAQQLIIVASDSSSRDEDLKTWMEDFSIKHGLPLKSTLRRGMVRRIFRRLIGAPGRISRRLKTTTLRSPKHDIPDVYLASIAAANHLNICGGDTWENKPS